MSDIRYTFAATKWRGGLVIEARPYFDRVVDTLGDGERFVLTLETFKDKRSNAQNRMAWGTLYDQLLYGIADAAGYDRHERAEAKELIHEGLCGKYQGYVTDKVTGQQVRKFRTSKATKQEFSFCRVCRRFCQANAHHHHIVFRSQGGKDTTANLITACADCHSDIHARRITVTGSADSTLQIVRAA